jgi:hypothetical protein
MDTHTTATGGGSQQLHVEQYNHACMLAHRALIDIATRAQPVINLPWAVLRIVAPALAKRLGTSTTARRLTDLALKLFDIVVVTCITLALQIADIAVRSTLMIRYGPRETGISTRSIARRIRYAITPPGTARRLIVLWLLIGTHVFTYFAGIVRAPLDCDALMAGSKECGLLHPDMTSACIRTDDNKFIGLRDWYIKGRDHDKQVVYETYANCKPTKTLRAKNVVVVSHTPTLRTHNLSGAPAYCAQLLAERSANDGKCADDIR